MSANSLTSLQIEVKFKSPSLDSGPTFLTNWPECSGNDTVCLSKLRHRRRLTSTRCSGTPTLGHVSSPGALSAMLWGSPSSAHTATETPTKRELPFQLQLLQPCLLPSMPVQPLSECSCIETPSENHQAKCFPHSWPTETTRDRRLLWPHTTKFCGDLWCSNVYLDCEELEQES